MNNLSKLLVLSSLFLFFFGCSVSRDGKPNAGYYYLNPGKDFSSIARVAFIELDNHSAYPQISLELTKSLYQAMQKKQIFSLMVFRQNNPVWRSLQNDLASGSSIENRVFETSCAYSFEQLAEIQKTLRHDAILIGVITDFKHYPHMAIGLRMKLIDLKDASLLWALDQVWDTADKNIEKRIKKYFSSHVRNGFNPIEEKLATVSSINFLKFVSFEVAETIKPD